MWLVELLSFLFGLDSGYQVSSKSANFRVDKRATKAYYNNDINTYDKQSILGKLELELLLIRFMLNEDDGKVSFNEKDIISKHLERYQLFISKDDLKRLKNLVKEDYSLATIKRHAELNDIDDYELNNIFDLLEIINQDTKKYTYIITRIRRYFNEN